ncbi:hypothetical protein SNE40_013124 [Patella caerulea]|uniref:Uncharacterized protein n=1 Tax=Patella caerulea TaxID=87958 RepID=A0AAN8JMX7_PATCE
MSVFFDFNDVLSMITKDDEEPETDFEAVDPVIELGPHPSKTNTQSDLKIFQTVESPVSSSPADISTGEISNSPAVDSSDEWVPKVDEENSDSDKSQDNDNNSTDRNKDEENIRSRKRKRYINKWKKCERKRQRQAGQAYTGSRGQAIPKRNVKTKKDCLGSCKFKCCSKVSHSDRQNIFASFWSLNDNEKNHFYSKTIDRAIKSRNRSKSKDKSRRTFSYIYNLYIEDSKIRVCKVFYLSTLDISQRRISYYFENKNDTASSTPMCGDQRGSKTKDRINQENKDFVREHIQSFPKVESHYCRQSTAKEYLESDLSITKMYRLYLERCEQDSKESVKEHIYRQIFNTEFNLSFFSPKKDRCDKCEEFRMKGRCNVLDEEFIELNRKHVE